MDWIKALHIHEINWLVDVFTSCTVADVRADIITVFTRIVCATIAFGLGIDCPAVIHKRWHIAKCRRDVPFDDKHEDFGSPRLCCDICACRCTCSIKLSEFTFLL